VRETLWNQEAESMARMEYRVRAGFFAATLLIGGATRSPAEVFSFGLDANNLLGAATKTIASGEYSMHLAAGPPGGGLWETSSALGMGVDATDVLGPGGQAARFDRINGVSEYIEFSFDAPGVLTGLNFDGVKDETFEYFILETTGGVRINLFDSAANTTVPGAIDNAVTQGAVVGQVVYLLEGGGFDDETNSLSVPFAAGQMFTLAYAEVGGGLGEAFEPIGEPNGARLQSITVAPVPEPSTAALWGASAAALWIACRWRRH
jgi:hypothetical protein